MPTCMCTMRRTLSRQYRINQGVWQQYFLFIPLQKIRFLLVGRPQSVQLVVVCLKPPTNLPSLVVYSLRLTAFRISLCRSLVVYHPPTLSKRSTSSSNAAADFCWEAPSGSFRFLAVNLARFFSGLGATVNRRAFFGFGAVGSLSSFSQGFLQ